jgi:hypothetical protein
VISEHNCPRCNAPFLYFTQINTRIFQCGSDTQIPSMACRYASQLQDRIKRLETALRKIANQDYRGNRSTESQIAFEALKP